MASKALTIVVDGGASGCRLAAFDANGKLCALAEDGPASLSLGEAQAWTHIRRGLASIAKQIHKSEDWLPEQLWMGLAGSLQRARRQQFLSLIPSIVEPVLITDGHAQLLGASGGQPGICLAIGTGSVIHWLDHDDKISKAGGWGYPVGDEASGAWLGSELINQYVWYRDAHGRKNTESIAATDFNTGSNKSSNNSSTVTLNDESVPALFVALEERIGTHVSAIQAWSTNTNSTRQASLAPIVVEQADAGDPIAIAILARGTHYCQQLIDLAPASLPVYLVGGLAQTYASRLDKRFAIRCQAPHGNALNGLYALSQDPIRHHA